MDDRTDLGIGELSALIGVTPRALRHYEQQGLLSPDRQANGYRVYDRRLQVRAANIKALFDLGLTAGDVLPQIEEGCLDEPLRDLPHCQAELAPIEARLGTLDELIARLQGVRERLRAHADEVSGALREDP